MLSQEVQERLAERLVERIEEGNSYILKKIGGTIKTIGTLNPTQAYQIGQILKYGGSYEDIARQIAKASGKNVQEIYKMFEEIAKTNKQFAKQFYDYRGIDFIPYNKDIALRRQVLGIASATANTYMNISRTTGIGLMFENLNGQMQFRPLQQSYYDIIDRAIITISQGKDTYYNEMRRIMKQIGHNGVLLYDSGRTRRLDSAIRMNLLDGIRELSNETSRIFGATYGADGIEISVHENPAPDHADIQGRQFSFSEYEKLENGQIARDYVGNRYDGSEKRRISELNCYHNEMQIVLGVSKPQYTDEQLREIQRRNEEGFEFEGKHYTMYEGTQLQRKLELEIRKNKDTQILSREAGDIELAKESQAKINDLTSKYNKLCIASNLKPKKARMSISGYRRISV